MGFTKPKGGRMSSEDKTEKEIWEDFWRKFRRNPYFPNLEVVSRYAILLLREMNERERISVLRSLFTTYEPTITDFEKSPEEESVNFPILEPLSPERVMEISEKNVIAEKLGLLLKKNLRKGIALSIAVQTIHDFLFDQILTPEQQGVALGLMLLPTTPFFPYVWDKIPYLSKTDAALEDSDLENDARHIHAPLTEDEILTIVFHLTARELAYFIFYPPDVERMILYLLKKASPTTQLKMLKLLRRNPSSHFRPPTEKEFILEIHRQVMEIIQDQQNPKAPFLC